MSAIVNFVSGKSLKVSESEYKQLMSRLTNGGVRYWEQRSTGNIVLLTSNTMTLIEHIMEAKSDAVHTVEQDDPVADRDEKSIEEARKLAEEKFMEKANCKHENKKLYIVSTNKGDRYFPACTFCGKRERYVSPDKVKNGEYKGTGNAVWTMKDILEAKPYEEKIEVEV